eukprot:Em0012g186a
MDKVSDQDDDKVDAKCKKEIKHLTTVYSLINSIANTTCICGEQEQLNTVTQQMKIQILIVDGLDKQSGFSIAPVAQYCSVALERVNKEIEAVGTPDDDGSVEVVKGRRINERIFEKMDMLTVWASEIEIFTDAQILQTSIFVGRGPQLASGISVPAPADCEESSSLREVLEGAEIELAGSVYEEKLFDLKTKNIVLDVSAINQAPEIQRRVPPDP